MKIDFTVEQLSILDRAYADWNSGMCGAMNLTTRLECEDDMISAIGRSTDKSLKLLREYK